MTKSKNKSGRNSDLSGKQKSAIVSAIKLGRKIGELFPGIAEDYRGGMTIAKIVDEYGLNSHFKIAGSVARTAVYFAISGYDGNFSIAEQDPYPGLIADKEEIKRIARKNIEKGSSMSGLAQKKLKTGIHAQTPAEKIKIGRDSAKTKGLVPFSDKEFRLINELSQQLEFKRKTRVNAKKIADAVNEELHDGKTVRTAKNITKALVRAERYKKEGLSFAEKSQKMKKKS